LVDLDELEEFGEVSGLSENEGPQEAYYNNSSAAGNTTTCGVSDPCYLTGPGTALRKLAPRMVSTLCVNSFLLLIVMPILQLQRSYATTTMIVPTTSVPSFSPPAIYPPCVKDKIQTGHLPPHIAVLFDSACAPHLHILFGKTTPWEAPLEDGIKKIWAAVFPAEKRLDFTTPLGGIIQKLVSHFNLHLRIEALINYPYNPDC
jgi:hypothetical protein